MNDLQKKLYVQGKTNNVTSAIRRPSLSSCTVNETRYKENLRLTNSLKRTNIDSVIELVASWFLNKTTMSHKKLQKLCYYAYCWYIVLYNDVEAFTEENMGGMDVLCSERFQAWIHGPVSLRLYHRYKGYGWRDIPCNTSKPNLIEKIELVLQQVWEAYGAFSADELEMISHNEMPWKKARKNLKDGEACSNEISNYDILQYYSSLG